MPRHPQPHDVSFSLQRVLVSLSYGFIETSLSEVLFIHGCQKLFALTKLSLSRAKKPLKNPSKLSPFFASMASIDNATPAHTVQATRRQAPTVNIEYSFDLEYLASIKVDVREQMQDCGIRGYFNLKNQAIYLELVRYF